MDRLKALSILIKVTEVGSFSRCAEELNMGQPAVSKAIDGLEKDLGVKILHRSTRSLSLTEEGRKVLAEARKVIDSYDDLTSIGQLKSKPSGIVRVTCPSALGSLYLIPTLRQFTKIYPDISIQLRISDSYLDLFENDIDVALRVGELETSQVIAKHIGRLSRIAVASEIYLRENDAPSSIADLENHSCIIVSRSGSIGVWEGLTAEKKAFAKEITGRFVVDNHLALRVAVQSGLGIGLGGKFLFVEKGSLHRGLSQVLQKVEFEPFPVHLLLRNTRNLPIRIRSFVDFIFDDIRKQKWIEK